MAQNYIMNQIFQSLIIRFIFSGGMAALTTFGVLYVLVRFFDAWYLTASTTAFLFGFFVSFVLQKFWTFKDMRKKALWWQMPVSLCVLLGAIFLNIFIMFVLVEMAGMWYMLAKVFSAVIIAALMFLFYGAFIFHYQKSDTGRYILVATGLYPPEVGGPATYSKLLEEELPQHGFRITVVPFSFVRRIPRVLRHVVYFLLLLEKGYGAEIFYALDGVSVGAPTLFAARLLRKRFLLRVAGDYAWEQYCQRDKLALKFPISNFQFPTLEEFQKKKFDFFTELQRKVEHFVARRAEKIVVPSEYLKKIVTLWGVHPGKIQVIYNTFDARMVENCREDLREKLGTKGTVVLSAGRLVPWKGFSALIETLFELRKEIPDIVLYIAGDGPERDNLKFQISNLKLEDRVFLTGRLSQEELQEYVQAADLFVLNTGYEGFSHQLLEVMATGTPIITTAVGGNPELIEDPKTGLLVTYNDKKALKTAIKLLIQDGGLRNVLAQNAKEKAQSFSKERAIRALLPVLNAYIL